MAREVKPHVADQPKPKKEPTAEQLAVEAEAHDFIVALRDRHPGLIIGYTLNADPAAITKFSSKHNTRPLTS